MHSGELAVAAATTGTTKIALMAKWWPPSRANRVVTGGDSGAMLRIKEEQRTNWALLPCYELRSLCIH